jgi:hypothetical protein
MTFGTEPLRQAITGVPVAIAARFGLVPNFFRSAPDAPFVVHELWKFAKSAYLDAPIPTLLKERLFVYLSRFCEVRYCVTRHCGFLLGLGRSGGDPNAHPMTITQVIRLLKRTSPMRSWSPKRLPDWKRSQSRLTGPPPRLRTTTICSLQPPYSFYSRRGPRERSEHCALPLAVKNSSC